MRHFGLISSGTLYLTSNISSVKSLTTFEDVRGCARIGDRFRTVRLCNNFFQKNAPQVKPTVDTIRYAQNVSKYAFSDRFIYPSKVNTAACTKNSKDISTDPEASDNNAINKQKNPRTRNMRGICASPFPSAQSRYCQLHVSQSIQHYTCKHVWCKRETLTKR